MDLPNGKTPCESLIDDEGARYRTFADDVFAPLYPHLLCDLERAWGRALVGAAVLEIGCGAGNMAVLLRDRGVRALTLVDLHPGMLAASRQRLDLTVTPARHAHTTYVCGDAVRLPLRAGVFDVIFSRGSLMFWSDLAGALDELSRVLANGGMVYVGAGYGVSTPAAVVAAVKERRSRHDGTTRGPRQQIPKIDAGVLADLATQRGGRVRMHEGQSGFWLEWRPKQALEV